MAQNGRTRGRKTVSHSSAKPSTRTKSSPRRIPGKKHKIVFSSMQTAILCVLIVAACFALLVVNSGRNPKNTAVEHRIVSQNADGAGDASRTADARQNADRQSLQKPQQNAGKPDERQSSGREAPRSDVPKKNAQEENVRQKERLS